MTAKAVELVLGGTLTLLMREVEPSQAGAVVTLTLDAFTVSAKGERIMFTLPNDKQVRVKVAYVDKSGNPATIDGDVRWASSDEAIARVTADADSDYASEAVISSGGTVGQAQITAAADADLGEGVRPLMTLMDVEVVGGEAVTGTIEPVGELEDAPGVDNTLPGSQPRPDNTLPQTPSTKPGSDATRPDNTLPGAQSRRR